MHQGPILQSFPTTGQLELSAQPTLEEHGILGNCESSKNPVADKTYQEFAESYILGSNESCLLHLKPSSGKGIFFALFR